MSQMIYLCNVFQGKHIKFGLWCNGSTTGFGSVCPGSNPGSPTEKVLRYNILELFLFLGLVQIDHTFLSSSLRGAMASSKKTSTNCTKKVTNTPSPLKTSNTIDLNYKSLERAEDCLESFQGFGYSLFVRRKKRDFIIDYKTVIQKKVR